MPEQTYWNGKPREEAAGAEPDDHRRVGAWNMRRAPKPNPKLPLSIQWRTVQYGPWNGAPGTRLDLVEPLS